MDLKKEQEYIDKFMEELSDQEFISMLEECGNNTILSTREIHRHLVEEGFYGDNSRYVTKTTYQLPVKFQSYDKYEKRGIERKREAAA